MLGPAITFFSTSHLRSSAGVGGRGSGRGGRRRPQQELRRGCDCEPWAGSEALAGEGKEGQGRIHQHGEVWRPLLRRDPVPSPDAPRPGSHGRPLQLWFLCERSLRRRKKTAAECGRVKAEPLKSYRCWTFWARSRDEDLRSPRAYGPGPCLVPKIFANQVP